MPGSPIRDAFSAFVDRIEAGEIEAEVHRSVASHEKACDKRKRDRHAIGDMLFPFDCSDL